MEAQRSRKQQESGESKVVLPQRCVNNEILTSTPPLKTMICAKIVEYLANNNTVAFAQLYVDGTKVFDGVVDDTKRVEAYKNMVGEDMAHLYLVLDTNKETLELVSNICPPNPPGSTTKIKCVDGYYPNSLFYGTNLVKWFSINMDLNDIGVSYNPKHTNIQSIIADIEQGLRASEIGQGLRDSIAKTLKSSGVAFEGDPNLYPKIQINHTKPYGVFDSPHKK